MNKKRVPAGNSKGGQFMPDTKGKNPPTVSHTTSILSANDSDAIDDYNEKIWRTYEKNISPNLPLKKLSKIVSQGNRGRAGFDDSQIVCSDGYSFSVVAGEGTYCLPKPNSDTNNPFTGPYTHVEMGFPSRRPEPWAEWEEYAENPKSPTDTVYPRVPVSMIEKLIQQHES